MQRPSQRCSINYLRLKKGSVKISTLVEHHADITSKLKDTTEHLKQALASSKKRGEWGRAHGGRYPEACRACRRHKLHKTKTLEGSSGRPDYTFFLPNSLKINMDVKFPLENYQNYLDAQTEHDKKDSKKNLSETQRL